MARDNWEPVDGPAGDEIERLNCAGLTVVVASFVKYELARHRGANPPIPGDAALLLFHRTAMQFLMAKPGRYRPGSAGRVKNGVVVMRGVSQRKLKGRMRQFFLGLESHWRTGDALDVAAYALWHVTRIHPFVNGNGRAAAAFAYACLCLKLGALLPGRETVLARILAEPAKLRSALRRAGKGAAGPAGKPSLDVLKKYLDDLLLRQMQSAQAETGAAIV